MTENEFTAKEQHQEYGEYSQDNTTIGIITSLFFKDLKSTVKSTIVFAICSIYFIWFAFLWRPAVIIVNNTGQTWSEVFFVIDEIDGVVYSGSLLEYDIPPGGKYYFDGRSKDGGLYWGFEQPTHYSEWTGWAFGIRYNNNPDRIALIDFYTRYRAPLLLFWRDQRVRIIVHEDNGVTLQKRWL